MIDDVVVPRSEANILRMEGAVVLVANVIEGMPGCFLYMECIEQQWGMVDVYPISFVEGVGSPSHSLGLSRMC